MKNVNAHALELAQAMVEYYELKAHCDNAGSNVLREDSRALRRAYDTMLMAQNDLALECAAFVMGNA